MGLNRVRDCLAAAAARLGGGEAPLEAEVLLQHVLGRSRAWLYAHAEDELAPAQAAAYAALVARRCAGQPVAYLTGTREFWSLRLKVTPATLIPRADTERLVELALERLPPGLPLQVADLGTGSGAIALAIAKERPLAQVAATDLSAAALAVAAENARDHGLVGLEFFHGPWLQPLRGRRFDLIVSNPPYIAADDSHLGRGDLRFEPSSALVAGADGLDDIRAIVAAAPVHLRPGAWLLLEHGYDQGAAVRALLQAAQFADSDTWQDLAGQDRVSGGRWNGVESEKV